MANLQNHSIAVDKQAKSLVNAVAKQVANSIHISACLGGSSCFGWSD